MTTRTLRIQGTLLELEHDTASIFLRRLIGATAARKSFAAIPILKELWSTEQLTPCERHAIRTTIPWVVPN